MRDTDLTIPDHIGSPDLDPADRCGLLPRQHQPGSVCGFVEDAPGFEIFTPAQCQQLLADPDRVLPTKRPGWQLDQNGHGSCASE